jgi:hypothetical protein
VSLPEPKRVLSLGAGVQSTTVLRMSIAGDLPPLDAAIFADTGWEPLAVYEHLESLRAEAGAAGIPVHVVRDGNILSDSHSDAERRRTVVPVFVSRPGGAVGMTRRKCTRDYKIRPIERKLKELIGHMKGARLPTTPRVEQWMGISLDEIDRAKFLHQQPDAWRRITYPLIDRMMTRADCEAWHDAKGFPRPPRSACVGCPYHSDDRWREVRRSSPEEFAEAVALDAAIRDVSDYGGAYLHRSCVPLGEVDFDRPDPQMSLWGEECEGMCGV